jgi:hypothetical protein
MTINKKGGKHKHLKRNRNNNPEDRKNPKHISRASVEIGEYYAVILKSLGSKRFDIKIVDRLWETGKKRTYNASMRGSKKMNRYRGILKNGNQSNRLIKVTYDSSIEFIDIIHAYQDWETEYLIEEEMCCPSGTEGEEQRIIMDASADAEGGFKFETVSGKRKDTFREKKKNTVSMSELTGLPSSSDEEDEDGEVKQHEFVALNKQRYKKVSKYKDTMSQKDFDDFIDNI